MDGTKERYLESKSSSNDEKGVIKDNERSTSDLDVQRRDDTTASMMHLVSCALHPHGRGLPTASEDLEQPAAPTSTFISRCPIRQFLVHGH